MPLLLVSGVLLAFAACKKDTPEAPETLPVMSFTNISTGGIVLDELGSTATVQVSLAPATVPGIERYVYKFVSENEGVFTVSQSGVVTAVGQGQARLKAVALNNTEVWTSCMVTVKGIQVSEINIAAAGQKISMSRDRTYPTFNLGQYVTVAPTDATNRILRYVSSDESVVLIDANGLIRAFGTGISTIRIEATDGSGIYAEAAVQVSGYAYFPLDRTGWSVAETSGTTTANLGNLIDSSAAATDLLLVKQGKTEGTGESAVVGPVSPARPYFVIDMGAPTEFNEVNIMHSSSSTSTNYRTNGGTVYGSSDGVSFTSLQAITWSQSGTAQLNVKLTDLHTYRYVKVEVSAYNTSGNYLLIKDFQLTKYVKSEYTFD